MSPAQRWSHKEGKGVEILTRGFQRMLLISEPEQTLKSPPEPKKRRLIASTLAIDILGDLHLKPQRISRYHGTFCALFISHQLVEKLNQCTGDSGNRETYTEFLWPLPHLSDHTPSATAEAGLPVRREKVCSQPPSWRSDTSLIGKSLDNENINSCQTAELPLKVKCLAAIPGDKHQANDAELQLDVRGEMLGHSSRQPILHPLPPCSPFSELSLPKRAGVPLPSSKRGAPPTGTETFRTASVPGTEKKSDSFKDMGRRYGLWGAGPGVSTSCVLQKFPGVIFTWSMLMMCVSVFTIQPEEHMVAVGSCQFHGRHPKTRFKVEGEAVAMRCPQVPYWDSASIHLNVTWRRNDSTTMVPGEEEMRVWVQDGSLWIVPALRGDSGTYICTVRNASYCDEMSVELRVFEKTEASLPLIFYPQIVTLSASGLLVCPDLSEFIGNKTDVKIRWYKDSAPLDQDNEKFLSVRGTRLLVNNVSLEDAGYYRCAMTFAHRGRQYNITRNIKLRVKKREEETIPVIISPHQTISASLGSRLTIPCKVFLGAGIHATTLLWWTANNTYVEDAYQGGRVTKGQRQEYSENNENYIEVPLIFDPVIREDLHTDFTCVVRNTMSFQMLRTTVKEAATFSWEITLAPFSLIFLVLGGMWMHRRCKRRTGKAYGWMELKTSHQILNPIRVK
ncbi:interleukin-1 receptor type 2 [Mesoplodon densirostris]|uniref:interleukin-1 receptor type 2 n=1 Tax=Mesoplodon densirostris TaxID=48708 RepID=UPI0028DC9B41|nr:interleukin-1 receptor type 2 [Mesoplodon densirostris]